MLTLTYTPKEFKCTCCGELKSEAEYYRQSYTNLRSNECKVCTNVKRSVVRNKARHGKFVSSEKRRSMVATVEYTLADWKASMLHFGGECCYCGVKEGRSKKAKFDREHLTPLSKGGKTVRNNIVGACAKCNRSRGNKDLFEWYRQQPSWTREREMKIITWMNQEGK